MKKSLPASLNAWFIAAAAALASPAMAFDSGSSGADGAFSPVVDTVKPLPPDGIFNFTSVNIPAGVTVRFEKKHRQHPGDVSGQRRCDDQRQYRSQRW